MLREKLETLVNRASAVEERVASIDSIEPAVGTGEVSKRQSHSTERGVLEEPRCVSLAYSTLSELLELVEVQNRLRLARIETEILKFCNEVVLPKHKDQ